MYFLFGSAMVFGKGSSSILSKKELYTLERLVRVLMFRS